MRLPWLPLVVVGCLSTTPGEQDVALTAFETLNINVSEQSFKLTLDDGGYSPRWGPCSVADAKLTAQLNDISIPLIQRGGKIGTSPGDDVDDNDCTQAVLQLDMPPPDGPSTLKLSDSSTTLICHLPDLKTARQATLIPPDTEPWTLRSGQDVAMQWSPSGDLPLWSAFFVELLHLAAPHTIDDLIFIHDNTFEGDVLHFTIPSSTAPGSYILELSPSRTVRCGVQRPLAQVSSTFTDFIIRPAITIVP
jgi:hypothetical protein